MAHAMFFSRVHVGEGLALPFGDAERVIAAPLVAARRPDKPAVHLAPKRLEEPVAPGKRQHGDEEGAAVGPADEPRLDLLHRDPEVLAEAGPARRVDSGRPA